MFAYRMLFLARQTYKSLAKTQLFDDAIFAEFLKEMGWLR